MNHLNSKQIACKIVPKKKREREKERLRGKNLMNGIRQLIVCGVNFSFKCNPFNKFNFTSQQHLNINIQCVCQI